MASRFGARRGEPEYDLFRTGLTFRSVRRMLWVNDEDSSRWKRKSRGVVLGLWHAIKLEWWRAVNPDTRL